MLTWLLPSPEPLSWLGRTNLMVLENTRVGQITSTDFV